jgi:Big-like domain-containing protein/VCBS repeat protein/FG-GAP repeat protein
MTRKVTQRFTVRIFAISILFVAVFTARIASVAQSRQPGAVYASPETINARLSSTTRPQTSRATSALPDQANPFFLPEVSYDSGGQGAGSVVIADVNKDGKPDIVLTNDTGESNGDGSVAVLLGNGDGTFQPAVLYDSGGLYPGWLAVADVNGDGIPDLIVLNAYVPGNQASGSVGVMLGYGNGTFHPVVTYAAGGANVSGIAVGDLNGDGQPDIVVTTCGGYCTDNGNDGTVNVLLANGGGTFQAPVVYAVYGAGGGVVIADVNGDGKPDLIVPYGAGGGRGGGVEVMLGNGDGTFSPGWSYNFDTPASSPLVADVNGDGIPDLLIATNQTIDVMLGRGNGQFDSPLVYLVNGLQPFSLAVADVNGDGKPDVIAATFTQIGVSSIAVGVLFGNGDGTFQTPVTYWAGGYGEGQLYTSAVAIADLNHDGKLDVAAIAGGSAPNSGNGVAAVLINNRQGPPYTPTTTTLATSVNPASLKQTITYTATVTSQSGGAVTGTVTFLDPTNNRNLPIAVVPLAGNQASCSVSYSKISTHAITASYSGDAANNFSNSATLHEHAGNLPLVSQTGLRTSSSPAAFGQAVTFTATVTWLEGTVPDGGAVSFSDGGTTIGSGLTVSGVVTLTTSTLSLGLHNITATYAGNATFKTSSRTITQEIKGYETSTTMVSSLNPSTYGLAVTWTATVLANGGSAAPTGKVNFTWGVSIGTATLDASGVAVLTRSNLSADSYPLAAVYLGDANNTGSTSSVLNQVVQEATSAATLTSSPNPSSSGQLVTFTATITSPTFIPTGPVTFTAGKTVLGTAELSGGKAKLTTSTLAVGSTTVTATYSGDSNVAGSSASVTQAVE